MKKLIKYIPLVILLSIALNQLFAQDDNYSREKDNSAKLKEEKKAKSSDNGISNRFLIGGGIGIQFGNPTLIELSPKIAYRLNPKAIIGGGVLYRYYHFNDPLTNLTIEGSDYGCSFFTSYDLFQNLFVWAEVELLNYNNTYNYSRIWFVSPFLGAGYRQPVGEKGFVQILLLYNLNYTTDSPYSSPLVTRIGIFF